MISLILFTLLAAEIVFTFVSNDNSEEKFALQKHIALSILKNLNTTSTNLAIITHNRTSDMAPITKKLTEISSIKYNSDVNNNIYLYKWANTLLKSNKTTAVFFYGKFSNNLSKEEKEILKKMKSTHLIFVIIGEVSQRLLDELLIIVGKQENIISLKSLEDFSEEIVQKPFQSEFFFYYL